MLLFVHHIRETTLFSFEINCFCPRPAEHRVAGSSQSILVVCNLSFVVGEVKAGCLNLFVFMLGRQAGCSIGLATSIDVYLLQHLVSPANNREKLEAFRVIRYLWNVLMLNTYGREETLTL